KATLTPQEKNGLEIFEAVVIGKGFSAQNLGYFTRANSFKQAPAHNMGTMVNKVTLPLFAKIQDDDKTLKRAYKKTVRFIVFAMAPLMFFAAAVAEPLFELLLTEKWVPAAAYFQILFIVAIVYPLNAFNLNILKVKGRSDIFLRLEIYKKAMAVVILAVAFQFGMYGLLWAMVAITLLGFTINSHHSGKFVNYPLAQQMRDILPFILIAGAVAVMVRIFDGTFGTRIPYGFLRVLAGLSVGAVLYFPIIRYTNPELMGEITHFFKRKK
ncbi:MAG: oligosaccharide flippase family protein, partial [Marinirhabdus sp.]